LTRLREWFLFGAFLLLGEVFLYHRMFLSGLRQTAGDYVNHLLANFVLEHSYLWLTGRPDHASFWDPPVFWPVRNVLAYAETLLGAAPLYWPWRLAGLPADTAYQMWLVTLSFLTFAAAWLLFRRGFGLATLPAALGAFFCAFGKNLAAQVNNPQLHTLFYSYFALYCLCRLFRDAGSRNSGWTAAFFAALVGQLWACFYLGWLFGFLLGLAALAMLAMPSLRPRLFAVLKANLVPALVLAPLAALALLPLVSRSLAVVRDLGWSNDTGLRPMMPHVLSWLYMGGRSLPYFWLNRTGIFAGLTGEPEERLGIGFVTAVCAAVGLWKGRENPWVRLAAGLALALVLLTTEFPGGFTLWTAVRAVVPGARALRIVARAGVLLVVPAGLGMALFVHKEGERRPRTFFTLFLVALCLGEQIYTEYTFSKVASRAVIQRMASAVDPKCPSFYLALRQTKPQETPHWVAQVEAGMAQIAAGVPTVNGGYTRFQPPGYGTLVRNTFRGEEEAARLRRDLDAWRARHGLRPEDVCWIAIDDPHEPSSRR
jgi:hypothetical protein